MGKIEFPISHHTQVNIRIALGKDQQARPWGADDLRRSGVTDECQPVGRCRLILREDLHFHRRLRLAVVFDSTGGFAATLGAGEPLVGP